MDEDFPELKKREMRALPADKRWELLMARDESHAAKKLVQETSLKEALELLRHPSSFHFKHATALSHSLRFWPMSHRLRFLESPYLEAFCQCLDYFVDKIQYAQHLHSSTWSHNDVGAPITDAERYARWLALHSIHVIHSKSEEDLLVLTTLVHCARKILNFKVRLDRDPPASIHRADLPSNLTSIRFDSPLYCRALE